MHAYTRASTPTSMHPLACAHARTHASALTFMCGVWCAPFPHFPGDASSKRDASKRHVYTRAWRASGCKCVGGGRRRERRRGLFVVARFRGAGRGGAGAWLRAQADAVSDGNSETSCVVTSVATATHTKNDAKHKRALWQRGWCCSWWCGVTAHHHSTRVIDSEILRFCDSFARQSHHPPQLLAVKLAPLLVWGRVWTYTDTRCKPRPSVCGAVWLTSISVCGRVWLRCMRAMLPQPPVHFP